MQWLADPKDLPECYRRPFAHNDLVQWVHLKPGKPSTPTQTPTPHPDWLHQTQSYNLLKALEAFGVKTLVVQQTVLSYTLNVDTMVKSTGLFPDSLDTSTSLADKVTSADFWEQRNILTARPFVTLPQSSFWQLHVQRDAVLTSSFQTSWRHMLDLKTLADTVGATRPFRCRVMQFDAKTDLKFPLWDSQGHWACAHLVFLMLRISLEWQLELTTPVPETEVGSVPQLMWFHKRGFFRDANALKWPLFWDPRLDSFLSQCVPASTTLTITHDMVRHMWMEVLYFHTMVYDPFHNFSTIALDARFSRNNHQHGLVQQCLVPNTCLRYDRVNHELMLVPIVANRITTDDHAKRALATINWYDDGTLQVEQVIRDECTCWRCQLHRDGALRKAQVTRCLTKGPEARTNALRLCLEHLERTERFCIHGIFKPLGVGVGVGTTLGSSSNNWDVKPNEQKGKPPTLSDAIVESECTRFVRILHEILRYNKPSDNQMFRDTYTMNHVFGTTCHLLEAIQGVKVKFGVELHEAILEFLTQHSRSIREQHYRLSYRDGLQWQIIQSIWLRMRSSSSQPGVDVGVRPSKKEAVEMEASQRSHVYALMVILRRSMMNYDWTGYEHALRHGMECLLRYDILGELSFPGFPMRSRYGYQKSLTNFVNRRSKQLDAIRAITPHSNTNDLAVLMMNQINSMFAFLS